MTSIMEFLLLQILLLNCLRLYRLSTASARQNALFWARQLSIIAKENSHAPCLFRSLAHGVKQRVYSEKNLK